jgi:hypothetical protein
MVKQSTQKIIVSGKKKPFNKPPQEIALNDKETPGQMVRSLQGIFCKGRYSSWAFAQNRIKE